MSTFNECGNCGNHIQLRQLAKNSATLRRIPREVEALRSCSGESPSSTENIPKCECKNIYFKNIRDRSVRIRNKALAKKALDQTK